MKQLAAEVRNKGWIIFPARSQRGDWDLFLMRPDGSERRAFTQTSEWNETWPQFSRDGSKVLYRRLKRGETVSGNRYGEQGMPVVANCDGTSQRVLGGDGDLPWATWSPDGKELATLSINGISFVEIETGKVRRTLARQGFYQQLTWSPDGKWLVGVANNFGTGWSIARMDVATGEINAVNRVDCCTPDWFPDSVNVIFSWRPPGQKTNRGQGWTQLWRADAAGKEARLVYAKDDRHAYGSFISPDGKYVIFTGNIEEDGDPGHNGGPMSLMRLRDAPIIEGDSARIRALHLEAKNGPILTLPAGWEPCWTFAEIGSGTGSLAVNALAHAGGAKEFGSASQESSGAAGGIVDEVNRLRAELQGRGWLVFSAPSEKGDWDLFAMHPDGTLRTRLTNTPDTHEMGPRFSPNGKQLLYYRAPRSSVVENNNYGTFELVIAEANGSSPHSLGEGHAWASWSPDGKRLACLARDGIHFLDSTTGQDLGGTIGRKGIMQQLIWSPDGRAFVGTANGLGPFWNIGVVLIEGDRITAVSETERYNCTPDWMPDSTWVLYARGIVGGQGGYAQLWRARRDGSKRQVLYAEADTHIYGGCSSPDGEHLLFTRSIEDLGGKENENISMSIIRTADVPLDVKAGATRVPRLDLGPGWEPHWTAAELPIKGGAAPR
jgi:Tol biopolymer transport system component